MNSLNPWYTQDAPLLLARRSTWMALATLTLVALLIGHYFFEKWLFLPPCVQCVYIRFGLLLMTLVAMVGAIAPQKRWARVLAQCVYLVPLVYTIRAALVLVRIDLVKHFPSLTGIFGVPPCTLETHFPLDLPLASLSHHWFAAEAICGSEVSQVPVCAKLSVLQSVLIDQITRDGSWYLIPYFKLISLGDIMFVLTVGLLIAIAVSLYHEAARAFRREDYF